MSRFICAIFSTALCYSAHAADWKEAGLQGATTGLLVIDWAQTRTVAKHPELYSETNWLLGRHPSTPRVNNYFVGAISLNVLAVPLLPTPYRRMVQGGVIGFELRAIGMGRMWGVKLTF